MTARWLNRIIAVLSWVGIYIAGSLTVMKMMGLSMPCGVEHSCDVVLTSKYAEFLGLPVSLFGLGAYLFLAAFAIARPLGVVTSWKQSTTAAFILSGIGAVMSGVFMYLSFAVIKSSCYWCIGSAVTMVVLFLVHGALLGQDEPEKSGFKQDAIVMGLACFLAIGGIAWTSTANSDKLNKVDEMTQDVTLEQLLPIRAKIEGPENARVTVIEFADYNCGGCQKAYPKVKELMGMYGPRVRWAYRHFPLYWKEGHETSARAAFIAEYAADKNLFWKFHELAFSESGNDLVKTVDGLDQLAQTAGLDMTELHKKLDSKDKDLADRVAADSILAKQIKIEATPTFVVWAVGLKPVKVNGAPALEKMLKEGPVAKVLQGG